MQLPLLPLPKTLSSFPTLDGKRERKQKNSSLRIISIRFSADLDPAAPRVVIADGYLIKLEFCLMLFLIQSLLLHLLYFYFLRICLNPPFHFQADFVTILILSAPQLIAPLHFMTLQLLTYVIYNGYWFLTWYRYRNTVLIYSIW